MGTDVAPVSLRPSAYSGKAVIGLAAVAVAFLVPFPFNILAAVLAMIAGLLSRRDLRADPELRGALASVIAFIVGAGILILNFLPALFGALTLLR